VLFRIADPRLTEASGLAAGQVSPGVFYVENDSGDVNRFFALDRRSGATAAVVTVSGARNVDWEDIAVGPDAGGTPSVWLADIGDNEAVRDEVDVYRVVEPRVRAAERDRPIRTPVRAVWRLRYPDGPVDAESLAVAPDGSAYIVTKWLGSSVVYRLPPHPDAGRVQLLRRVAAITFSPTGTGNPFGPAGQLLATSAAFARDGSTFAVRTYADAYVWRVGSGSLAAALRRAPIRIALPRQPQGEGLAIVGRQLVIDSEGRHSAAYAVPVPVPATLLPHGRAGGAGSPLPDAGRPSRDRAGDAVVAALVAGAGVLAAIAAFAVARGLRARRQP
jgi:hypothetical protein